MNIFDRVSFLDKLLFTKHLSVMVKSGIPLSEAIISLHEQALNTAFKKVLGGVSAEVANGQSLEKALSKYPKVFDPLYTSLVSIGEESGTLETNLEYLAKLLGKNYEFKQKVKSALLYPTFVVVVALTIGFGIAIFVLPQLVSLFESLDAKLPLTTQILLFVSKVMRNFGIFIVFGFLGVIAAFSFAVKTKQIKPYWHKFLLRVPVIGTFICYVETASMCRNLGLMLRSGFPITRALETLEVATENLVFKSYIKSIKEAVEKGRTIESELSTKKYPFMPSIVAKMVDVGEKTGKLDETLTYLADFFEEEVDSMAKNFPTILEPILLVVIAGMVAFLALAIITPIYEFTASVKR